MSSKSHQATKQQQRDRVRRRQERQHAAAAKQVHERRRTMQAAVIALAALVVVAALVILTRVVGTEEVPDSSQAAVTCTQAPQAPGSSTLLDLPDPSAAQGQKFGAVITTNCGDIAVTLDGKRAPQAVASFVSLAEGSFYDDSPCHRLLTSGNVVVQCGDPTGTGTGGPGYGFGVEYVPEDGLYPRGTLAMARTNDLESGTGSQFFIVDQDSAWPPSGGGYTVFGNVTTGMEIIDHVVAAGVAGGGVDGPPAQPLSILSIAVTEK